jgi:hypothetical protein
MFTRFRAHGTMVDRGTILQTGRSQIRFSIISMEFSSYLILPASLYSWGPQSL